MKTSHTPENNIRQYIYKPCVCVVENVKSLNCLKAPKTLADAFHTSAKEWGCVQVGDARSTDGLERYSFPGELCVSTARRKIFFLLLSETDRVAFCKQQMYGRRDVDLADTLCALRSKSPDERLQKYVVCGSGRVQKEES